MGNKICCQESSEGRDGIIIQVYPIQDPDQSNHDKSVKQPNSPHSPQPEPQLPPSLPQLSEKIQSHLQIHSTVSLKTEPFQLQIGKNSKIIALKSHTYQGNVNNEGLPDGYGRLYFENKSVLIAKFSNGVPMGPVHYIWQDGSYYRGCVQNWMAKDSDAMYFCDEYVYKGGFRDNLFQGEGTIESTSGRDEFKFEGSFVQGKRKNGKLMWKEIQSTLLPMSNSRVQYPIEFIYQGNFDNNELFTGKATFEGPKGVYIGDFQNGMKHGNGVFNFKNGLIFEGTYLNNIRDGIGIIKNKGGIVLYEGQFKEGLPHGKGKTPNKDGILQEVDWNQGITTQIIEQNYTPAKRLL